MRDREIQEETRGRPMRCEVADESVVVLKFRPVKAGNRLEDKIGMTYSDEFVRGNIRQKRYCLRRDEVYSMFSGD